MQADREKESNRGETAGYGSRKGSRMSLECMVVKHTESIGGSLVVYANVCENSR